MRRSVILVVVLAVCLVFALAGPLALAGAMIPQGPGGDTDPIPNPDPGQDPEALAPNLSFPVVMTDYLEAFYETEVILVENGAGELVEQTVFVLGDDGLPIPIAVEENITRKYTGSYPGQDLFEYGAWVPGDDLATTDVVEEYYWFTMDLVDYLHQNEPWYPQPSDDYPENTWRAETRLTGDDEVIDIDFVDWGNPLENISPTVGYRFPVEVALYQLLDEPMTAYKMGCLEYQSTREELFGTSELGGDGFTWQSKYATVLTRDFEAWVVGPNGYMADIDLEPGIGPSGKMNFASAGGGWMPTVSGWHRIYLRICDSSIDMGDAIVNNDEHYYMADGVKLEDLSKNKLEMSGVYMNETWIDIYVVPKSGKRVK